MGTSGYQWVPVYQVPVYQVYQVYQKDQDQINGATYISDVVLNLKLIELYPLKPHHLQRAKTPLWPPGQKLSLIFLSI